MTSLAPDVVLVGLCDGELDNKRHQSTFMTSKVGGIPDVPSPLSCSCPRCCRCGAALVHVVQVYCPLEGSPYHRTLHVFACPGEDCSGRSECWRVLRSQCLEEADSVSRPTPPQEQPLSATVWCESADDWGMEEDDGWGGKVKKDSPDTTCQNGTKEIPATDEMDVSSKLEELQLGPSKDNVPCLRPYFISVVEETDLFGEDYDLTHAQELLRDYEKREGVAIGDLDGFEDGGGGGEEKYEKTKARHGDAVFSRFMKKISICPEQILRYSRGGKPLFISEPPANMSGVVSTCGSCGGPRVFELQLMPALVSLLRGKDSEIQLEFGTVLVHTCLKSCWTSVSKSAVEEFCFVQPDPDQQLFK